MKQMLTLVLLATNIFAMAQEKKTDVQKENLKGKVKTLSEITYKAHKNNDVLEKQTEKPLEKKHIIYNNKGYKLEEHKFEAETNGNEKWTYKYDKNKLVERKRTSDKDIFTIYGKLKYDSQGNKIEENVYTDYGNEVYINKYTFKYDSKNNLIEENFYGSGEKIENSITYSYNKKGKEIECNRYNHKGLRFENIQSEYNGKGELIATNVYDEADKLTIKKIFQYDEKGNIVSREIQHFNSNIPPPPPMGMPVAGNNKTESKDDEEMHYTQKETYKYTKYDAKGNWIERLEYFSEKLSSITEREIEYYQ